jgi:phosphoribosylformylglycinamidine synthase
MASPNLASRRWIWQQYDQSVGGDTVQRPGGDAAVVRVHGSKKALAITCDVTPRYCYADPYEGGKQAVAEAYRNLCAVGAKPLAITNCLNFGNPQRPEIMAQLVGCLEGMADACRALDFPIVSGNVSLYNETKNEDGSSLAILPTPAIGGVGLLNDWQNSATIGFKAAEEDICVVGHFRLGTHLGKSLWLGECAGRDEGIPPSVSLESERELGELMIRLIRAGFATAVHDISDGGLAVAVAEMALAGGIGAVLDDPASRPFYVGKTESKESISKRLEQHTRDNLGAIAKRTEMLFGEDQGRYIFTVPRSKFDDFVSFQDSEPVLLNNSLRRIGTTGGNSIRMNYNWSVDRATPSYWEVPLADLRAAHESFFPKLMGSELTPEF